MSWFTIIKNPNLKVGSKVTTSLGIDSKEEDDSCKRKIEEYIDKVAFNMPDLYHEQTGIYPTTLTGEKSNIPEEVYCLALKLLNRLKFNEELLEKITVNGSKYEVKVRYFYTGEGIGTKYYKPKHPSAVMMLNIYGGVKSEYGQLITDDMALEILAESKGVEKNEFGQSIWFGEDRNFAGNREKAIKDVDFR